MDQIIEPRQADRVRIDEGELQELALSIKERGLINPILVRPEGQLYEIVAGNRRFLAHRWLGRAAIECKVRDCDANTAAHDRFVENIQRSDLNPTEEAFAVRRMRDQNGNTVPEIARACGKSEGWVRLRLQVLDWPEDIIARISEGKLSLAVAGQLAAIDDDLERYRLTAFAIDNGINASTAQSWRAGWEATRQPINPTSAEHTPAHTHAAAILPMFPCWGCSNPTDILKLQLLRFCPECVILLSAAKNAPAQAHEPVAR